MVHHLFNRKSAAAALLAAVLILTSLTSIFAIGDKEALNVGALNPTLYDRLLSDLRREMREEIGLSFRPSQITVLGMINEDESAVGRCHLGIVFKVHLDVCQKLSFSREIANPEWQRMEQLPLEHFELWSKLAIRLATTGR